MEQKGDGGRDIMEMFALSSRVFQTENDVKQLRKEMDNVTTVLFATGTPHPGIVTRTDRLEQRDIGHSKAVVVLSSVIAAVIAASAQIVSVLISH